MALGTYVELIVAVADTTAARAFYEQLGFRPVAEAVLTDGSYNLRLQAGDFASPTLHYAGVDLATLRAAGLALTEAGQGQARLTSPNGVPILLSAAESPVPMPPGDVRSRTSLSQLGMFGEFSIGVADLASARAFWEQLGFTAPETYSEPYPWGIFIDDLFVVGLHQYRAEMQLDPDNPISRKPHLTYFAADMADRIAELRARGVPLVELPSAEPGPAGNARMIGPGDQPFWLFSAAL